MEVWEKRESIIQREGEAAVRDRFDNSIMFQNTVAITEKMYRNTNHTARSILNILLKNTEFTAFLHQRKILFFDDAIAMGRTAVTCELLLRSFYDEASWGFSSVASDDGYASLGEVFASPGPDRLPENRPDLVPLFGSEVRYLPQTRIPIYTTYSASDLLQGLQKEYEEHRWDTNRMKEDLVRYNIELKKFVLQNIEEIIAIIQRDRITSEENDPEVERKKYLDTWKYIDENIDLFVSIIKMNMRGTKKSGVMFTYVHDYLAPHPWLGEEMNSYKIGIRAMTEVLKRIEKDNPSLFTALQQQDSHIRVYEELLIVERWIQDKKDFIASQKRGIDRLRTDARLRSLVDAYCSVGLTLWAE